jgi:hypothetical protein
MAVFTAIAIAGLAISAVQGIRAARAAKKAGELEQEASESQAELGDYNAAVAELQATDAIDRGAEEESRFRSQVRGMIGQQRTEFAANNVDVNFGSAVDVQADTAFLGELDALTIRTNAAREAWGYKVQAEDTRRQAAITRKEGRQQRQAGNERSKQQYIATGANLLTGASQLADRYGWGDK